LRWQPRGLTPYRQDAQRNRGAERKIVTDCSAIGFVASALVLAAFGMKDMVNLRIVAICSNVAFITCAVMLNLQPILILHVILLPLNAWRLAQELQSRRMFQTHRAKAPSSDTDTDTDSARPSIEAKPPLVIQTSPALSLPHHLAQCRFTPKADIVHHAGNVCFVPNTPWSFAIEAFKSRWDRQS
jgi:hypothetical protein